MFSSKVAAEIGSRLGEVVEVEKRQKLEAQNFFMRVKVSIPTSKPIRWGGFIGGSDGKRYWVTFKYERLPLFCHFCGFLGHHLKHCAEYFAQSKNGGGVGCQYGEWLKSASGRPRSPSRTGSAKNQNPSSDGTTEAQNVNGSSPVRPAAELVHNEVNPIEGDRHAKGKDGKTGASLDCTDHVSVTVVSTKERLMPHLLANKLEIPFSNNESISHISSESHVEVK